ncbi:carbohydrate sulfotransferase 15-like [Amphiura filiformis]|uniref:carbohydrate sulfotransferase 15-like n=1 Tax=Amphiura filiformis TaxID=82378 RepID=UPI003B213225
MEHRVEKRICWRVFLAVLTSSLIFLLSFGISLNNTAPSVAQTQNKLLEITFKSVQNLSNITSRPRYQMPNNPDNQPIIKEVEKKDIGITKGSHRKETQPSQDMIREEIMKYYSKLMNRFKTKQFLPDYKNPCVLEKEKIRCLPYFYLIGAPKSGTTDLWWNIVRHPSVVRRVKEGSWWTNEEKTYWYISNYLDKQHSLVERANKSSTARASLIIGDGSASTLWDNHLILHASSTSENGELPFVWADVIHCIQPGAKIIAILREPVERTISSYFAFGENQSPEDFHSNVEKEINRFNDCLKTRTLRTCANLSYYPRIQVSVYISHIREWLRVYPRKRKQVLILRTEDWHNRLKLHLLPKVFTFLEINPMTEKQLRPLWAEAKSIQNKEVSKHGERKFGTILQETKQLLRNFYRPYNEQLAEFLEDDRFLWKND